tara:strand:- start:263 stop:751 length:489 start_codon:yes stop_codon:yes gene_type:complete
MTTKIESFFNKLFIIIKMPWTKEQRKNYDQSPAGKKSNRISHWKSIGIIDEDLGAVYDYLIKETHCMICFKEYKDSQDRCLDHDHDTGEIRYICCQNCNVHFLREKNPVYTKPHNTNTSGYLNISYVKRDKKWIFKKQINGETIHKYFDTLEEAIHYRDNIY